MFRIDECALRILLEICRTQEFDWPQNGIELKGREISLRSNIDKDDSINIASDTRKFQDERSCLHLKQVTTNTTNTTNLSLIGHLI